MKKKKTHPSYGMIGFSRISGGNPNLFGSSVKHNEKIQLTIKRASTERDLSIEWYFGRETVCEVEMSYSQFAEAISAMNVGDGVPCTISYTEKDGRIEPCDFTSNTETFRNEMAENIQTANADTEKLLSDVESLFLQKKTLNKADKEEILRSLTMIRNNINSNLNYVAKQFDEHIEKVTQEAKGEIEAFTERKMRSIALSAIAEKEMAQMQQIDDRTFRLLDEQNN